MTVPSPGLRDRVPIYALLAANSVSKVGNTMAMVAIPWFVLQTTDSAAQTGITGAVMGLGAVLAAFFGGPVVERLGFKRTSVLADIASGVTTALIPLLYAAGSLPFVALLVFVFLGAVLDAPGESARDAIMPELARGAGMPLERANSFDAAVPRMAQFLGPPVAGVLIVAFEATGVLWFNAASFAFSALLVAVVVPAIAVEKATEGTSGGVRGYFGELAEGIGFVWKDRLLLTMVLVVTVANLLDAPKWAVIVPVYVKEVFGSAAVLGVLLGSFGAGALAGTLLFGAIGHRTPRRLTFSICFFLVPALMYLSLVLSLPMAGLVFALALAGLIAGPINPIIMSVVQERTPPAMRGRVFGVLNALAIGGVPVGMAAGGFLIEGFGLMPTLLAMGGVYLLVTGSMFFNPALRGMERTAGARNRETVEVREAWE
jgi:MFS family permease